MTAVSRRIKNVNLLDGERVFLREGNLNKTCRSGRKVTYRFFLFSDMLIYASAVFRSSDLWNSHQQLQLSLLRVSDEDAGDTFAFRIHHPKKSFTVSALSLVEKKNWMQTISKAVDDAISKSHRLAALKDVGSSPNLLIPSPSSSEPRPRSLDMKAGLVDGSDDLKRHKERQGQ